MGFKNNDGESWERGGEEDAAADTLPWVAHTTRAHVMCVHVSGIT